MKKLSTMLLAVVMMTGCATMPPPRSASPSPSVPASTSVPSAMTVSVNRDEFRKLTQYKGSDVFSNSADTLFIRAWKPDGGAVTYQIYVADYYRGEWRFYSSVYDNDGYQFNVTQIGRDVGSCSRYVGCSHTETMGLNVTREYLEKFREKSLTFKLIGRAGEQVFVLPAPFVAKFLDSVSDTGPSSGSSQPTSTSPPAVTLPPQRAAPGAASPVAPGQDAYSASKSATAAGCHQKPTPVLAAKGPGFETYTVACTSGDTIMLRCEFGNCRILR